MNRSPTLLKYFWLYLGGASISLAICTLLLLFFKQHIETIDIYAYWFQTIGLMIALSVVGKNIQLIGWLFFTLGSGVRTAFFASYDGPLHELNAVLCTIAILLETGVMFYNGRNKHISSEDWLVAIVTLAQFLTIALIRAWFL